MQPDDRLPKLEGRVDALEDDVTAIQQELSGPGERSVRNRLHGLENSEIAARAVEAARIALDATERANHAERDRRVMTLLTGANIVAVVVLAIFK